MQKEKVEERAVEFLDWIDTHFDDWVTISCAIGLLDIGDTDTMNILKKAYEYGFMEIFFTYLMNVQESKAISEAREKHAVKMIRREIENSSLDRFVKDFEQLLQERQKAGGRR